MIKLLLLAAFFPLALSAADGLQHESEVGIAIASGNSSSSTYQIKQLTAYGWDANTVKLMGHYLYGIAKGVEAAKNWDLTGRYERALSDRFSVYASHGWEGDIFVGYEYRNNTGGGGKYFILPGDGKNNYLATEAGYRYTYEKHVAAATVPELKSNFVRGYLEGAHELTETVSAKAFVEALEDLSHGDNFQLNFEVALAVVMTKTFSLKLAYDGKYRNSPLVAGNTKYDSIFIAGLLAKF